MSKDDKPSGTDDAGSKNQPDPADKPKSLPALLDEWEGGDKSKVDDEPRNADDVMARLSVLERREAKREYDAEMTNVVSELKGEHDIDDFFVEAWANKQADDDPRLAKIFEERDQNPKAWNDAVKAMKPAFDDFVESKSIPKGGDVDAAAVRLSKSVRASTDDSDDVDWGNLSDGDFALKKAEVFRTAESGGYR